MAVQAPGGRDSSVVQLAAPPRSGFAEVNRASLRVWEWGDEDAPPVLCIHGAGDHGRMFDDFAPRLAAALGRRVIAPDLRGHGDSSRLGSGHMWMASALDIGELARWATGGSDRARAGIVGHSFGGGQAAYAAAVFPERFSWVVNLDGLGPPTEAFGEEGNIVENATRSVANAERVLFGPPRVYRSQAEMVDRRQEINRRLPRPWVEHLVAHGSCEVDGGYTWKSDPMFRVGFPGDFDFAYLAAEFELLTLPLLALTGEEHDTWSELSDEHLAERLSFFPDARHRVIPGAGHYVHIEQPDAVVAAIAEFVAEIEVDVEVVAS